MFLNATVFQVILVFCILFLALKAGLEIEWAAVVKPLRKALKKYVQNGSHVGGGDEKVDEVQIAEDESVERYIMLDNLVILAVNDNNNCFTTLCPGLPR